VPAFGGITGDGGTIRIGAAASHGLVVASPLVRRGAAGLVDAALIVGSVQIRTVATLAGNVCNASPAADTVPALIAQDAIAEIQRAGEPARTVPVEQLLVGPGRTTLAPDEIVCSIAIPSLAVAEGSAYRRHTARASMDLAFVGVAARVRLDASGAILAARIVLGAVGPTAIVAREAAAELIGRRPEADTLAAAGKAAAAEARPITDLRASDRYRRQLVAVLVADVVGVACARARSAGDRAEDPLG
jgi:carbon-monoxide dehydrogenase medium subunit